MFGFSVTATNNASAAASMICRQEGMFKLIMAKADMPDMDILSFLDAILEKDIPVICKFQFRSCSSLNFLQDFADLI